MAKQESRAPDFYSVEAAASITNRNPQIVRRYIQAGKVAAIPHPTDKRAMLIPFDQIDAILAQPTLGAKPRTAILTMSDGSRRLYQYMESAPRKSKKEV